jgi:hypothetical protein
MKKLGLLLLITLFWAGCRKDDNSLSSKNFDSLRNLPITDAAALFISNDASTKADGEEDETGTLYKITYDGKTERVEYVDGLGHTIPAQTVCIIDLSKKYTYIQVWAPSYGEQGLLVRKTDGAVYMGTDDFQSDIFMKLPFYFNHEYKHQGDGSPAVSQLELLKHKTEVQSKIQVDLAGDVYFLQGWGGPIMKFTDEEGGDTRLETLTGEHMKIDRWIVNPNGDIFLSPENLCRLKDGEYKNYKPVNNQYHFTPSFVLHSQPNHWYGWMDVAYGSLYQLGKYDPRSQENELLDFTLNSNVWMNSLYCKKNGGCIVFINKNQVASIDDEKEIRIIELDQPFAGQIISEKYCFSVSDNSIACADLQTGHVETIFDFTSYKLLTYCQGAHDTMILLVLDLKSGNEVLLEVAGDGTVTDLETYAGHSVWQLERIQ